MSRFSRVPAATVATLCMLCAAFPSRAAQGEEWEWMVAPYLWAASIGTDLRTGQPPAETDTSFSDIIDKIDGAFQVHAEGQGERFGMFADYIFLGLEDDKDFTRIRTRSTWIRNCSSWPPCGARAKGATAVSTSSAACVMSTWT